MFRKSEKIGKIRQKFEIIVLFFTVLLSLVTSYRAFSVNKIFKEGLENFNNKKEEIKLIENKSKQYAENLKVQRISSEENSLKPMKEKKHIEVAKNKPNRKKKLKNVAANRSKNVSIKTYQTATTKSDFKSLLPKHKITLKNSPELKLVKSSYTDDLGFSKIGEDYLVALGSYYGGKSVGCRFLVTMSTGVKYTVIKADNKADRHTDSSNRYHLTDGSQIEFVVDMGKMRNVNPMVPKMGNASYSKDGKFEGVVESIIQIE